MKSFHSGHVMLWTVRGAVASLIFSFDLALCASVFLTALLEVDGAKMFPFPPWRDSDLFNNSLAPTS